ncbi:MAG: glycosyltransferase [Lachnospiraceae bacterium]|nr:glycosyltransferase [Lachnospiraceae bacterium]
MSIKSFIKQMLVKKLNKDYQQELSGKKFSYDTWVRSVEAERQIVAPTGDSEDFVVFTYSRGTLAKDAPALIREYMSRQKNVQIAYGDEDFIEDGKRVEPWYKPVWSPDLYQEFFYTGSVVVMRLPLLAKAGIRLPRLEKWDGISVAVIESVAGLRALVDPVIALAGGFEKGCESIGHLEAVLFHGEKIENVREFYGARMRSNLPKTSNAGKVSVVIPSKDNPEVLAVCLKSLEEQKGIEIIVVDNGSSPENREKYQVLLERHKYIYEPMEFDFSAMCNLGAGQATGKYLLFLNDDMEMVKSGWLKYMKEKASLSYVGAVGLKLLYPDSDKIQHAGIVNLPVGPVHKCQFASDSENYYFGRNKYNHNCIAVTGACLLIDKEKYHEAGGLKTHLPVAYNDVELGFALYELGYQNVVINKYFAYHHESLSRGNDELSKEKLERLFRERAKLYEMHPDLLGKDPYYPEGLSKDGLDSRFAPLYFSAGNRMQKGESTSFAFAEAEVRIDKCVMATADTSVPGQIRGYGVVLGDDNACYDKYLVLVPFGGKLSDAYQMKLTRQYRQDLEQNMPDQKNVALSGFWVECQSGGLPQGDYEVAILAVHKLNKGKLLNYTNRSITVSE